MTQEEYEELSRCAIRAGFKATAYFKKASFAYINNEYVVPVNIEKKLGEIIWLLRNIGNNLNQLSARANTLKKTTVFDLLKAKKNLHDLEVTIKNFVRNPPKQKQSDDCKIDEQKIGKLRTTT